MISSDSNLKQSINYKFNQIQSFKAFYPLFGNSSFPIVSVRINDDDSFVLVIVPSEDDLKFLLDPDIEDEDNRVYYVALSRAIENLFVNIPQLSDENKVEIKRMGFEVVDLNNN